MSYFLDDVTLANTDQFQLTGIQDPLTDIAWFEFQNESSYSLAVRCGGYQFQIPAWTGWPVATAFSAGFGLPINIRPKAILNYQSSAPGNTLSTIIYRVGERPAHTAPYTLARQTNIGNSVPVGTQVSQVVNTGNTAPTAVLSGTPSGASSPEAVINNDGSATLGGGLVVLNNVGVFTSIPLDSIPVGALAAGTLDTDVIVPYAQSLNDQVTSTDNGTAQVFSTVDGRGIALGYKDSGGTYHQVLTINTDGTVTAGTLHATADDATQATYLNSALKAVDDSSATSVDIAPYAQAAGADRALLFQAWIAGALYNNVSLGKQIGGSPIWSDTGGGWHAAALFPDNGGGSLSGISHISGSGSATVNHGLAVTPDAAVVNTNNGSNSTTFGSGSYTATTVYIYQYNPQPWVGVVYKS